MTAKTKKVLFLTIIPLLIAVVIAYYFYNKGPVDVTDQQGIAVDAPALYKAYINDTAKAGSTYGGKVIEVSGEIQEVAKLGEKEIIIKLKSGVEGAYINCSMESVNENFPATGKVKIKGICDGILMDEEMGIPGDIIVKRSVLIRC